MDFFKIVFCRVVCICVDWEEFDLVGEVFGIFGGSIDVEMEV